MRVKLLSSLEKCFLDESIFDKADAPEGCSMLKNEKFSFQICYDMEETVMNHQWVQMKIVSPLKEYFHLYRVRQIPSSLPVFRDKTDDYYLRKTPGLYPDLLEPYGEMGRLTADNNLNAVWLEIDPQGKAAAGVYPVKAIFYKNGTDEILGEVETEIEIIDAELPKQELIYTQWFYPDCLADYYGVTAFDEEHWRITENFLRAAREYGQNMILTPLFTTVLNSAKGEIYRTRSQLVGVEKKGNEYSFDFTQLGRWVDLCDKLGFEYFEIGHFFTQGGAQFSPKVYATENGQQIELFGWNTPSDAPEYFAFLGALIPATMTYLREEKKGADARCWFHISDEPRSQDIERYCKLKDFIKPLIGDRPIFDALYDYRFYEAGIVEHPVPCTNHVKAFVEHDVPDLWVYNCGWQTKDHLTNRFFSMPSARNRVQGVQMYKYDLQGFLHWGYNYYNSQGSYHPINPFICSDGEGWVPSGDTYTVYPAPDGTAWPSLRQIVFNEGLQDLRALKLLEKFYGREKAVEVLEAGIDPITFEEYPIGAGWLLNLRKRINELIKENVTK